MKYYFRIKNSLKEKWIELSPIWDEIMSITWPAFIELVAMTLFGMVDMVMVGQLGPAAITSIGLTNQPIMLLLSVFAAVNVGTTTLVAWNVGAQNIKRACDVTRQAIMINLILGVAISLLGVVLAPYIVKFMGAGEDTFSLSTQYFQIISLGLLFQCLTMAVTAALRGAGDTKIPMAYNIGANLLNVFGNYVLIYGKLGFPQMGVAGAALSTTLSRVVSCIVSLVIIYLSKKSVLHIEFKGKYRLHFKTIRQMFSIGLPAAVEQFILHSGLMFFARTVSGLGTVAYAAHQIGLNINGLAFSPSMAFGVASTTLVGQSLGADDVKKAKKYADVVHSIAVSVACCVGLIYILFSHSIARLYTSDLTVIAMAGTVLKIMAFAQPGQSTQLSLAGALRGAGDTIYPLYASFFGIWIFRVAIAYVFVNIFNWGLIGAWVSMLLDQYARAFIIYWRFRSGKWQYMKMRSAETKPAM